MTDDTIIPPAGYDAFKNCNVGDAVRATARDGTQYTGTVQSTPGATVIAQSPDRTILAFRGLKDNTGPHILLGIDGKNEILKMRGRDFTDEIVKLNVGKTLSIDTTRDIA